ncbi:hypothetical protein E2C01_029423 [Portunus trituberculatus]|uniref:Uncharacterized protein n=1 Tax=Portunus trituberculatus TaxID=210409 RepID=A0A5B7EUK3_PORTR|nr:hypothetical protein [Portunus trituberculatus]
MLQVNTVAFVVAHCRAWRAVPGEIARLQTSNLLVCSRAKAEKMLPGKRFASARVHCPLVWTDH